LTSTPFSYSGFSAQPEVWYGDHLHGGIYRRNSADRRCNGRIFRRPPAAVHTEGHLRRPAPDHLLSDAHGAPPRHGDKGGRTRGGKPAVCPCAGAVDEKLEIEGCLVVGMPLILAIIIAFLPFPVIQSFPALLRPVAGNSFVVGVISVLFLEHVLFKH